MYVQEALLLDLRLGRFKIRPHAVKRMIERNVSVADISNLGHGGIVVEQKNHRYRVQGEDLDGESLSAIVFFDGDSTIITVME